MRQHEQVNNILSAQNKLLLLLYIAIIIIKRIQNKLNFLLHPFDDDDNDEVYGCDADGCCSYLSACLLAAWCDDVLCWCDAR